MNTSFNRRGFIRFLAASAATSTLVSCANTSSQKTIGRVIVVGAGYGGATAAKYLRMWSPDIEVILIERNAEFVSCPLSNLVLGGSKTIQDVTVSYSKLSKYGIKLIQDEAIFVDPVKQKIKLGYRDELDYDRLILSPGVDFIYEQIPGLNNSSAQEKVLHAWKAGTQTIALRKQLEAMSDGGVYALAIPKAPYRCPPGPYERACQVAFYFKNAKPKSKVLVLDANEDIVSKKGLFTKVWKEHYGNIIEYRNNSELKDVDTNTLTAKLEFDSVKADVLNVLPPMKAARIAEVAGLITANNRWCGVNWLTTESVVHKNIHVLGDATLSAPAMPKSGHMANQHAKACAAAIIELMHGRSPNPEPMMNNTCYSFVSDKEVIHVASVHRYDSTQKTMVAVKDSGGLSPGPTELEGAYGWAWGQNIWSDMLG